MVVENIGSLSGLSAGPTAESLGDLDRKLAMLGMEQVTMEGDGNCQFRSFADQLFGDQKHHGAVRASVVAHMRAHADYYGMFTEDLDSYLGGMATDCTWGDELTLAAVVETYGCVAHLITSTESNWYIVYRPEDLVQTGRVPRGVKPPPPGKETFLSYISPVHYNAICAARETPSSG